MEPLPICCLLAIVFGNRYFAGLFIKRLRGSHFDETIEGYEPSVTVVIPLYNEGKGIFATIESLLEQDYPANKLTVTVIDDCSKDDSYEWACKSARLHPDRVHVLRNPHNMGKRRGIIRAVRMATSEIIVSVDSDVVVHREAVRQLVKRFVRPELAAVGGRVNVLNANENFLTKIQAIKYHFGYQYLKNLERAFSSVMCLSGCLTAYRRHVLLELEPILEKRNILGVPIKYGEDRYLTRQIVRAGYQTTNTLDAVCWTVAPNTITKYFQQQLRWRRSNSVDFMLGLSHAWKLHPCVALHYLGLFALMMSYPLIIAESLLAGTFLDIALFHLLVLAGFGGVYWLDTRKLPPAERVHPLYFLGASVVMPVTYALYTPLALFTLDSSSWETRGQPASPQTVTVPDVAVAAGMGGGDA